MGSALLDTTPGTAANAAEAVAEAATRISAGEALRQQAAERLAAHRNRRAGLKPTRDIAQQAATSANARAAQIAAAVAERYAKSQSYRAFLAAEAERAVQQARAAAEVAAIKADAIEAAQQNLLEALEIAAADAPSEIISEAIRTPDSILAPEELSFWPEAETPRPTRHVAPRRTSKPDAPEHAENAASEPMGVGAGFSPRLRATPNPRGFSPGSSTSSPLGAPAAPFAIRLEDDVVLPRLAREALHENRSFDRDDSEALALDEEIAFRQAPVFEDFTTRPEPLPANLIEFPRQLVASRKARPRLAEGPLREDASSHDDGQLRIFEVETAQISTEPAVEEAEAPQWTSIFLDAPKPAPAAAPEPAAAAPSPAIGPPGAASVARRTAAAAINGCIVGLATAAFAAAAMVTSGNVEALRSFSLGTAARMLLSADGRNLLSAGVVVAVLLWIVYQALFFAFSTATPGMRCVRIGLCTFRDENPSRKSMRRRILAILLSAVPFGLGFIWAALDEEKLSWHDRVSGMYQRTY